MFSRRLLWMSVGALTSAIALPSFATERTEFAVLMVAFDQMAIRESGQITKWPTKEPLKLKIGTKIGERENAVLEYAIKVVEENTKLKIRREDDGAEQQISVELTKEYLPAAALGGAGGRTRATWLLWGGSLKKAVIDIRDDWYRINAYYFHHVIPHEMMHAIGFLEHAQGFDSVTSYYGTRNSYSEWDEMFMRVLYDPRLPSGTPRPFALPLVCRLLHERLIKEENAFVSDLSREGRQPYCEELSRRPIEAKSPLSKRGSGGPISPAWASSPTSSKPRNGCTARPIKATARRASFSSS